MKEQSLEPSEEVARREVEEEGDMRRKDEDVRRVMEQEQERSDDEEGAQVVKDTDSLHSVEKEEVKSDDEDGDDEATARIKVEVNPEEDEEHLEESGEEDDEDDGKEEHSEFRLALGMKEEECSNYLKGDVKEELEQEEEPRRKRMKLLGGECEWCGSAFPTGAKLLEHQRRRHAEELGERQGRPVARHSCTFCAKVFTVKKDFDRHQRHSHGPGGGRPRQDFICDLCGFATTRAIYLKGHKAKNHGIFTSYSRSFGMVALTALQLFSFPNFL